MISPHTGWFVVILLIRGIVAFFAIKGWYTILCSGIHPAYWCFHSCRMFFCLSRPSCSCFICTPHGIQCGWLVGHAVSNMPANAIMIMFFAFMLITILLCLRCNVSAETNNGRPTPLGENEPTSRSLSTCHPHLGHVDTFLFHIFICACCRHR